MPVDLQIMPHMNRHCGFLTFLSISEKKNNLRHHEATGSEQCCFFLQLKWRSSNKINKEKKKENLHKAEQICPSKYSAYDFSETENGNASTKQNTK